MCMMYMYVHVCSDYVHVLCIILFHCVQECQVLTISSSGQMTDRLSLQPSVESNGYIVKVGVAFLT